jgi:rhamnosyltransferase
MISIIIPTFNPGEDFRELLRLLREQTVGAELIIIDSSNKKGLIDMLTSPYNVERIIKIRSEDFNHGATRNLGLSASKGDIVVYLTQDAMPADNRCVEKLIQPILDDHSVGATYGRQLPRKNAGSVEAHARLFNYPACSEVKTLSDKERLGIKAPFVSNSFSAYRKEALVSIGGFPSYVIMCEDMYAGAKLLLNNWKVVYCADAMVYHSHNYTILQEFRRYFDIGVFHYSEKWILQTFGKAEGEGLKFMVSEFKYLLKKNPFLIPSAIIRNMMKFAGFRLGLLEHSMPLWLKQRLSMNRGFWSSQ